MRSKLPKVSVVVCLTQICILHVQGDCGYERIDDLCYTTSLSSKIISEQIQDCLRDNGILAEPLTSEQNQNIKGYLCDGGTLQNKATSYVFGLRYNRQTQKWRFSNSSVDLNYSDWQSNKPVVLERFLHCAEYVTGSGGQCKWNNIECQISRYAVCQKKLAGCLGQTPCYNGGNCMGNKTCCAHEAPSCTCPSGVYGPQCQYKPPSVPPRNNCPEYVSENTMLRCTCTATDLGNPTAEVGWTAPLFASPTPSLQISNVTRDMEKRQYTCELLWTFGGAAPVNLSSTYLLQVAYGPSGAGHHIEGPHEFRTDGLRPLTLTCLYEPDDVYPRNPVIMWTGVTCNQGQSSSKCTFRPKGFHQGRKVSCTIQNRGSKKSSSAVFTLNIIATTAEKGKSKSGTSWAAVYIAGG
ncbi:hypothetical protein BaRGS_00002084, partial [Batillaria attramentaria]